MRTRMPAIGRARHPRTAGFTLVEIVLTIVGLAVLVAILFAIFGRSRTPAPIFSFLRNVITAPTTPPVDVYGVFTPVPTRFLAIRRAQSVTFTLTVLPPGTPVNPIPAGTATAPLPGVNVTFTVSGPVTFAAGQLVTVATDAQGQATVQVFGSEQTGTATLKATVTLTDANGTPVSATEQISVPVERP